MLIFTTSFLHRSQRHSSRRKGERKRRKGEKNVPLEKKKQGWIVQRSGIENSQKLYGKKKSRFKDDIWQKLRMKKISIIY